MSDVNKVKKDASGEVRPFGGLNVIFVGDFWQLDPPKGALLGAIPVDFIRYAFKYDPKPDAAHGQAMFWHRGKGCVQGVPELTECARTEDAWLLQVQNEMRAGCLSEDSWHFLHAPHYGPREYGGWPVGVRERRLPGFMVRHAD